MDTYRVDACAATVWPNWLDDTAVNHGVHHKGFANEHEIENEGCDGTDALHNLDTDYRHLAYHVAWFIYDEFSRDGKAIDVVAHSMGGLIIRYAIGAAERGQDDWPPFLYVENVVTIASPHGGTKWGCAAYYGSWVNWKGYQAAQFCRASEVAQDMMTNMRHPNGFNDDVFIPTYWLTMGSANDGVVVPTSRSVEMDADYKIIYFNSREVCEGDPSYGHTELYRDVEEISGDRCIAWMFKGHASYNDPWEDWPWWDKAMRPGPDMYKHAVT